MNDLDADIAIPIGAAALDKVSDNAEQMLEDLYDQYAQSLFRYARSLVGSPEDAEDAVQEVFIRIARERERTARIRNLKAYLFTAIRNAAYSQLRGRRRRDALAEAAAGDVVCGDVRRSPAESIALSKVFAELPVEQREVLALKVYEEMTFEEIARTVGVSLNTVYSRYRYGIAKLKQALEVADNG